jgi:hypothetical protein
MFVEFPDVEERRRMLEQLKGIERRIWVQVDSLERIYAIADEDLERENEEKTAAVHFLRFELLPAARDRLRAGVRLMIGVDHPQYRVSVEAGAEQRASLVEDLL